MSIPCPACNFENPDDFAFCGKCGAKLAVSCPHCGAEVPPGFAFCGKCGTRLAPAAPPNLITDADLTRLTTYLPAGDADRLPPAPLWQASDLDAAETQLRSLFDNVTTYLPRYLVETELSIGATIPVGGEFLEGALLFADISGFTALSERLNTLGKEGAEQIVILVNDYFGAMLDVLFAYNGDLFKFGGDALLAYFPGADLGCVNAVLAAWTMQQAMADFHQVQTSLGAFPLKMKIGLHAGTFFAARVGNDDEREFIITGETINATAKAESLASAGQILISSDIYTQVQHYDWLRAEPGPSDHHLVTGVALSSPILHPPGYKVFELPVSPDDEAPSTTMLRGILTALDRLAPYLPPGLLPRLILDPMRQESSGEHRLVVVLFANFVGASELVAHLGLGREAEIAHALNTYFVAMHEAIARYGGVVNKVDLYDHGDKLMALFGAPVAHEDDAERAVRAALDMQRAIENDMAHLPIAFRQRIGISTGMVFAGHVGAAIRHEYTVMGDEVNLAARLMSASAEGDILLASYVQRKIRAFFEVEDRGEVNLKGKSKPVPTYTIVGRRAQPEPVRGIRGLRSALVGRAKEQTTLRNAVADLCIGRGGIISLIGEAGLGKSRMMAELRANVLEEIDLTWIEGRCLSYTQQVSYSAFDDVVNSTLGIVDTDNEFDIRNKLQQRMDALPNGIGDDIRPYLARFLNLAPSAPEAERVAYLQGEALQRQILRAIAVMFEHIAHERPLLLVIDDLHWADSASLALLERCLALSDRVPVLFILLYRPIRAHGCWVLGQTAARNYPHRYTEIQLSPLDMGAGQDRELVCNLLNLAELPPALTQLISRAEGNPFYVEEIIRALIDQGAVASQEKGWELVRDIDVQTVPDTLQGLIVARMDQLLEQARLTLQLASVIGRTFRHQVLSWLASAAALAAQLDSSLATLQRAELIRERSRLPELEYIFKHVMVRDVAYESMLLRNRRIYHGLVAERLEELYSGQKREEVYELLAHHYSLSNHRERALSYLMQAGNKARAAYANPEAIAFYRRADRLAEQLGRTEEQMTIAEGWGDVLFHIGKSEEALACYERAMVCCANPQRKADLYRRMAMVYEKRGEYVQALDACESGIEELHSDEQTSFEMARLLIERSRIYRQQGQNDNAIHDGETSLHILKHTYHYTEIAQAHNVLGLVYRVSQPDKAIQHLEQGLSILERTGNEYEAAKNYNNLAILYYQSDLSLSSEYFQRTLETMQRLGNVWEEATAYMNLGVVYYAQRKYSQAIDYYQHSLDMGEKLGNTQGVADCHINLGETHRALGNPNQAIVHLEQGLVIAQKIGASDAEGECHRQLAECYLEIHAPERALTACEKALAYARNTGNRQEEAAIYRVVGKAHTEMHNELEALENLEQSIAILRELNQEFDLGTALYDYGQVLNSADHPQKARLAFIEALEIFERLGLPQEQERVRAALAKYHK